VEVRGEWVEKLGLRASGKLANKRKAADKVE